MSHWSYDAGNLMVFGRSQTGKTTAAREIHAENNRISIWLNERGKHRVPNVAGKEVRGIKAIESGLAAGETKFNFLSSNRDRDIAILQEWAWNKADRYNREMPMQIVADELQRLAPNSGKKDLKGRDTVRILLKEGMKRGVKLVGITQDPVSVDRQSRSQREYLLLFPLAKEQSDTIRDYVDNLGVVKQQPEYTGVVFHADGRIVQSGIKAKGKYA